MYDAAIGRWFCQDPMAEDYYEWSPYTYCLNDPIKFIDPTGEDVYMYFYVSGEEGKPEDEAMFWAAALSRAQDMLSNGTIKEGDAYTFKSISDIGKLGEAVDGVVEELSPQFGKTAEFGLWSHAGIDDGPRGSEATTGDYALGKQMTPAGWGDINFNWKNDGFGAQAMFFGCRTASTKDNDGSSVTPWAQKISQNSNMKNVEVWGQTSYSYPSLYPDASRTTSNMNNDIHGGPTYMVGSTKDLQKKVDRRLRKEGYGYPMGVYQNGKFLRNQYQSYRKR